MQYFLMEKKSSDMVRFGRKVRACREQAGMSQEAAAERAGMDRTYLSGIERGVRNPCLRNIIALARALGVQPADFF